MLNIFVLPWRKWLNCRPNDKLQQAEEGATESRGSRGSKRLKYSIEFCAITLIVPRIFVGVGNCKYLLVFISAQHSHTHAQAQGQTRHLHSVTRKSTLRLVPCRRYDNAEHKIVDIFVICF